MPSLLLIVSVAAMLGDSGACKPARGLDAATILRRAADRTGLSRAAGSVLHVNAFDLKSHAFESDRPAAAPYMMEVTSIDHWFDPSTGVERVTPRTVIGGYRFSPGTVIGDARASYAVRDTTLTANEELHGAAYESRPLNVWAVLDDWLATGDARVEGTCAYRDYPRVVLAHGQGSAVERLFIDFKSGYPVKLDRVEPHYLWGQTHVEYVYSTWQRVGGAHFPEATFRMEDGATVATRTFESTSLVSRDSAPRMTIPPRSAPLARAMPAFMTPTRPDTIRVSANTVLLKNRGFTETVTLARDTVFVFDATQGEERVRQDSAWIATLFPGRHPIAVVVTDVAWPHIAGVRAWVARGATIIAHHAAREFIASVVNRRWTLEPDLLERRRSRVSFRFRSVGDTLRLAGGDILLFPIDGAASEVALAAFVRPDRFLWASDYVQDLTTPTQYVDEVFAAVNRAGVSPLKVAAEHLPLSSWDRVVPLAERFP